jgi:hypothetical protein
MWGIETLVADLECKYRKEVLKIAVIVSVGYNNLYFFKFYKAPTIFRNSI